MTFAIYDIKGQFYLSRGEQSGIFISHGGLPNGYVPSSGGELGRELTSASSGRSRVTPAWRVHLAPPRAALARQRSTVEYCKALRLRITNSTSANSLILRHCCPLGSALLHRTLCTRE